MTFVSYAQNFEDVILWRALNHVRDGRYIDIGAQDPVIDSVSFAFYEAGWRGIHAEPNPTSAALLREARPDEIVIEAAVTAAAGPIPFYELGGLSSGREDIAEHHRRSGHQPRRILVPTVRLDALLELPDADIHWMKVDVEGMEADVLRSWGDCPIRPWVLVIEATYPNSEERTEHLWIDEVLRRGYREVFFDGLSCYFLHEAHAELADRLNHPANVFDAYQITLQHFSSKQARDEAEARQQAGEAKEAQLETELSAVRDRLRGAELELDSERSMHALSRRDAATQAAEAQARIEGAETALAADRARFQELAAQQRESEAEIESLGAQLRSEQQARASRDSEIKKIAKLAGADSRDLPGATYAAVKSRLRLAEKELELVSAHAERQYAAGLSARDAEVGFLNDRIAALQVEIAETGKRMRQFEAAYAAAGARADAGDKDRGRLQALLDDQDRALAAVRAEAAGLDRQLGEVRRQVVSIYESKGGRLGAFLGLLPKRGPEQITVEPTAPPLGPSKSQDTNEPGIAAPQHGLEIAVNDVRHVSNLLALNGATFVDALYRTFLKRAPDRAGRDHFIGRLQAGHGKEAVLLAVATSPESKAIDAQVEGLAELQNAQRRSGGWFSRRDRALEERLNSIEFSMGEAQARFLERLDRIQNSVDQIQANLSSGGRFRSATADDGRNGVAKSIKHGISVSPPASAPAFIDSLREEVQSSSEALVLARS